MLLCAVALVYLEVIEGKTANLEAILANSAARDTQFVAIAELLNDPSVAKYKKNLEETRDDLKKIESVVWVNQAFGLLLDITRR